MPPKETTRYGYLENDDTVMESHDGWFLKIGGTRVYLSSMCEPHEHKLVEVRIREIKEQSQEATLMSKVQILEPSVA